MRPTPELAPIVVRGEGNVPAEEAEAPRIAGGMEAEPAAEPAVEPQVPGAPVEAGGGTEAPADGGGPGARAAKRERGAGQGRAKRGGGKKADGKSEARAKGRRARPTDLEVEVKLRCESLDCLTSAGLDVVEVEPKHFEDNWVFKLPDGKLRKGQYLRVRYQGDGNGSGVRREGLLTYKGKSKRTGDSQKGKNRGKKVREEIETTIGQPAKAVKILKRLGLKRSFRYQKFRSVHRVTLDDGASLLAMYDETPIGNFLELEGDSDLIERVATTLGFKPDDFLAESYVEMQVARCAARGEPLGDMVFAPLERREVRSGARDAGRGKKKGRSPKRKGGARKERGQAKDGGS